MKRMKNFVSVLITTTPRRKEKSWGEIKDMKKKRGSVMDQPLVE